MAFVYLQVDIVIFIELGGNVDYVVNGGWGVIVSLVGRISNNLAQMVTIMTKCVTRKNCVAMSNVKVIL
jgi:hypothetical protein